MGKRDGDIVSLGIDDGAEGTEGSSQAQVRENFCLDQSTHPWSGL